MVPSLLPAPSEQRLRLAQQLRSLRKSRGFTSLRLAHRSGLSQARISRIETGDALPAASEIEKLMEALEATDADKAAILQTAINLHPLSEHHVEWMAMGRGEVLDPEGGGLAEPLDTLSNGLSVGQLELRAGLVREIAVAVIPGLLQTAEYAESMMRGGRTPEIWIHESVASRMSRQKVLFAKDKRFVFLLTEAALAARYLDDSGMAAQLQQIVSLASLPNVSVGVLENGTSLDAVASAQMILFDDSCVVIDTVIATIATHSERDNEIAHSHFDRLAKCARWGDEAIEVLRNRLSSAMADSVVVDIT